MNESLISALDQQPSMYKRKFSRSLNLSFCMVCLCIHLELHCVLGSDCFSAEKLINPEMETISSEIYCSNTRLMNPPRKLSIVGSRLEIISRWQNNATQVQTKPSTMSRSAYKLFTVFFFFASQSVQLVKGTEQYDRWVEVPQPLEFKVYIFNVTNQDEIQRGMPPKVHEIGPYVYT